MTLRVVVAEDHALMRAGVVSVLGGGGISVVATATSLDEARTAVATHQPDALVTDIRMPPNHLDEGIILARELRVVAPQLGVVVLSQHVNAQFATAVLDGGSGRRAYLLKDHITDERGLCDAVHTVVAGGSVVDGAVVDVLMNAERRGRTLVSFLTPREREVLEQMATGASNALVARVLGLSERSVEKHSNAVFAKLGVTEDLDVNRRVKAVLLLLADTGAGHVHRVP